MSLSEHIKFVGVPRSIQESIIRTVAGALSDEEDDETTRIREIKGLKKDIKEKEDIMLARKCRDPHRGRKGLYKSLDVLISCWNGDKPLPVEKPGLIPYEEDMVNKFLTRRLKYTASETMTPEDKVKIFRAYIKLAGGGLKLGHLMLYDYIFPEVPDIAQVDDSLKGLCEAITRVNDELKEKLSKEIAEDKKFLAELEKRAPKPKKQKVSQ